MQIAGKMRERPPRRSDERRLDGGYYQESRKLKQYKKKKIEKKIKEWHDKQNGRTKYLRQVENIQAKE